MRGHQRLAKQAGAKVRNDHRHRRDTAPPPPPRRADRRAADRTGSASRASCGCRSKAAPQCTNTARLWRLGGLEHRDAPLIVNRHLVHGGKQARRSASPSSPNACSSSRRGVWQRRIEHEARRRSGRDDAGRPPRPMLRHRARSRSASRDRPGADRAPFRHRSASCSSVPGASQPSTAAAHQPDRRRRAACVASAPSVRKKFEEKKWQCASASMGTG